MKPAVIYARYSSHAQREESIEQQVSVCRDYCARRGLDVLRVYADAARSGRTTDNRDEFLRMISDARAGDFGAVVVYKLDRFARDRYDSVINKKRLRDCGVSVLSAMENIPEGPEGRLMEAVVEGVAEWYSADLSQKTIRGMRANAEKCLANGVRVYGYDVGPDGRYVVNDEQAAVIRRVFADWMRGKPAADISRDVGAMGVRTATGRLPGRQWASHIIHDERYMGVYWWKDVRIVGGMPAIIDADSWRLANARRRATAAPQRIYDYPLAGRLFDADSGGVAMTGYSVRSHGRAYVYYSANVGGRHYIVPRDDLEGAVVRAVTGAFSNAAFLEDVLDRIDALRSDVGESDEVRAARATVRDCDAAERRLMSVVLGAGDMVPDVIAATLRENELRKLGAQAVIDRAAESVATRDEVRAFLLNLAERATPREIIDRMVHRVDVFRGEGAVVVTLPIKEALNPARGFSAIPVWLPHAFVGANARPWHVTRDCLHLFALIA